MCKYIYIYDRAPPVGGTVVRGGGVAKPVVPRPPRDAVDLVPPTPRDAVDLVPRVQPD